jgi:pimeloyl-ACP methyl ester carboxylesterase
MLQSTRFMRRRFAFVFPALCLFALTPSWALEPTRDSAWSPAGLDRVNSNGRSEQLELALKRYEKPHGIPVLLIHGLAQNDRIWDSPRERYSFAKTLHKRGFDVWIANLRGAGTSGYRSDQPAGPNHWTVDDYAAFDIPALIDRVSQQSGQKPFVIVHSLSAWAMEGYLAGLALDENRRFKGHPLRGRQNQAKIRGLVTIAGVYGVWWRKPLDEFIKNPIRTEAEFYGSNYELELLARIKPLYQWVPNLEKLPLNWMDEVLMLPVDRIPWVGPLLSGLYIHLQQEVIRTPLLSMFFYPRNTDPEMIRLHVRDGMEDLGPKLIEQLANAIKDKRTMTHYHGEPEAHSYSYGSVRRWGIQIPLLFVGGGRDRLAGVDQIYHDGYLATKAKDKSFIGVEDAGHIDILSGKNAEQQVVNPVIEWMLRR